MVTLGISVRATNDKNWKRIQEISQFNYRTLMQSPQLVDEFILLVSDNCTFVDNWTDNCITHDTFRVYSRKVPVCAAANQYIKQVHRQINNNQLRERNCEDFVKNKISHAEWQRALDLTKNGLSRKKKEPKNYFSSKVLFLNALTMEMENLVRVNLLYFINF